MFVVREVTLDEALGLVSSLANLTSTHYESESVYQGHNGAGHPVLVITGTAMKPKVLTISQS